MPEYSFRHFLPGHALASTSWISPSLRTFSKNKQARKKHFEPKFKVLLNLVGPAGVEPTTNGLKVQNSIQLCNAFSMLYSVCKKRCAE
jgi:hypothetical protein